MNEIKPASIDATATAVESTTASAGSAAAISALQREFREALGEAEYQRLHRESQAFDLLTAAGAPAAAAAAFWAIGLETVNWGGKLVLSLLIGWLMTLMGLIAHDLFVHRRRWGDRTSWLLNALFFALMTSRGTGYAQAHIRHHARIGTADDTEAYKQDIDTRLRRWLFATFVGIKLAYAGRWARQRRYDYLDAAPRDARQARRVAIEIWLGRLIPLAFALYAIVDPLRALLGYFVPLLVVVPVLNSLRIIIEHADMDPSNPYWLATHYRTGWFSQIVFLADSGDCHLVHHVFPRIPFYRVPRAARLFRPLLAARGVVEQRSYLRLLRGWFVAAYPHRSRWPGPAA